MPWLQEEHAAPLAQGLVMTGFLAIPTAAQANTPVSALLFDHGRCGAPGAKCFGAHWFWFSFDTPTFWFNRCRLRRGPDRFYLSFQDGYKIVGDTLYFSNDNLQMVDGGHQPGYLLLPLLQYLI